MDDIMKKAMQAVDEELARPNPSLAPDPTIMDGTTAVSIGLLEKLKRQLSEEEKKLSSAVDVLTETEALRAQLDVNCRALDTAIGVIRNGLDAIEMAKPHDAEAAEMKFPFHGLEEATEQDEVA